ncbi:MAG: hypothetical protein KC609_24155, partial [Myxococcales bacterium]|nr:hypothetical protein [Myxococcales bacterium]
MQNSRSAQRFVACFSLVFSFCVALLPGPARAQNLDARLVDTSLSPYGLIGVQTNRNLGHLELHGVLNFGYVNDPLVGQRGVRQLKLIGERMILEAGLVLGVIDRLEIGLALPIYLRQRADAATPNSGKSAGIGMLRFVAKGTILENRRYHGFGLGLYLDLALPTGTRNARMGETMIHGTPGLILDFRRAFWAVSLNLGYRFRKIVRAEGLVIDDEVRLGLGVEIPLHRDVVTLIAETTAAIQTGPGIENGDLQSRIPVELLGALRWRSPFGLILTLGAGFGATHGVTASDFRAFVSLGYGGSLVGRPRSRERDLEPTLGPTTRRPSPTAPTVTEPTKTLIPPFVAKRLLSAPQLDRLTIVDDDYDGDGIPLSRDKCPNEPEDIDGFED